MIHAFPRPRSRRDTFGRSIEGATRPDRLDWIDPVRALGAISVVALHASIPYADRPMPGLVWATTDQPSFAIDIILWTTELFVMPLFLGVSGLLAAKTLATGGPAKLWESRRRRLAKPLLLGLVLLLPLEIYLWLAGFYWDGLVAAAKFRSLKIEGPLGEHLWGTSHLWYLVYLLTFVGLASLLSTGRACSRRFARGWRMVVPRPEWCVIGLLSIAVMVVAGSPRVVWGFQHAFAPEPSKWFYSGAWFAVGMCVWSCRTIEAAPRTPDRWGIVFGTALITGTTAVALGRWHLANHDAVTLAAAPPWMASAGSFTHWLLAGLSVAASASLCWALVVFAKRSTSRRPAPPWVRRVAAASFVMYLLHHPIVAAAHIGFKHAAPRTPPEVKFTLVFLGTVVVCLSIHTLSSRFAERRVVSTTGPEFGGTLKITPTPGRAASSESTPTRQAA